MEGQQQQHLGDHRPAEQVANPNGRGLQMGFPVAPLVFVNLVIPPTKQKDIKLKEATKQN